MPIIDDKRFKTALLKNLREEPDYKRAKGAHNDAWSLATAKYYAPLLDQANARLKQIRDAVATPAHLKPAFDVARRRELLGALGARLEYYAWQYHCALAHGNHNVMPDPAPADVQNFCPAGLPATLAAHAARTVVTQFGNYVQDVVTHVAADWNAIRDVFFPNWQLQKLVRIKASGSDSHKLGHSVVFLYIEGVRPPPVGPISVGAHVRNVLTRTPTKLLQLVYKPSDLSIDYYMVGDTQRVVAANPGGLPPLPPGGSLFENINALVVGGHLNAAAAYVGRPFVPLPTYAILPRNSGNVAQAYGYIKFLKHRPEAEPNQQKDNFTVKLRDKDQPRYDWVTTSDSDLINYYRIFGWYCAVGLTFGIADAHNQNLIVHKRKPYLIDLEISFKWICDSIGKTGLQDVMGSSGPAKGDRCHIFHRNGSNLKRTNGNHAAVCINAGITEAMDLFQRDPGNVLQGWLGSGALGNAIARYTPRATRAFGEALRTVYCDGPLPVGPGAGAAACLAPVPNPAMPGSFTAFFPLLGGIKAWYNGGETEHRPNFALLAPTHDWQDYLNCDYPVYYRRLNSLDLLNARGATVQVAAPPYVYNHASIQANRNRVIAGTHYFDHYPAVYLFEVDVTTLPAPAGTLAHLNGNVIADLTQSFAVAVPPINLTGAAVESTEKDDEHWRIIDGATIYHIRVVPGTTTVAVYKAGTAIEMVQRQYDRLRNDVAFRTQLINNAQNYMTAHYVTPGDGSVYDSF